LFDKTGKVELYEYIVKDIKKFYENSPYPKSNYPILNEVGMPTTVKRFVEVKIYIYIWIFIYLYL